MAVMDYAVVVTTDGNQGRLEAALASLDKYVRPRPAAGVIVDDSGNIHYRHWLEAVSRHRGWALATHPYRQGFCQTVADAWALAAEAAAPWILWLPDDFEFVRPIDLSALAHVLACEPHVAQMGLAPMSDIVPVERRGSGTVAWQSRRVAWSPDPSLFRRELAATLAWPIDEPCEYVFGQRLAEARPETRFGVWGAGADPWVERLA